MITSVSINYEKHTLTTKLDRIPIVRTRCTSVVPRLMDRSKSRGFENRCPVCLTLYSANNLSQI